MLSVMTYFCFALWQLLEGLWEPQPKLSWRPKVADCAPLVYCHSELQIIFLKNAIVVDWYYQLSSVIHEERRMDYSSDTFVCKTLIRKQVVVWNVQKKVSFFPPVSFRICGDHLKRTIGNIRIVKGEHHLNHFPLFGSSPIQIHFRESRLKTHIRKEDQELWTWTSTSVTGGILVRGRQICRYYYAWICAWPCSQSTCT